MVIEKDITFPFDVDKTLIFWVPTGVEPPPDALRADYYGETVAFVVHKEHVRLLRASLKRGRNVIVWSGNGYEWARNVMAALGFDVNDPNLLIMSKPAGYVDDLPAAQWMGNRVWVPSDRKLPWRDDDECKPQG